MGSTAPLATYTLLQVSNGLPVGNNKRISWSDVAMELDDTKFTRRKDKAKGHETKQYPETRV